MNNRRGGGTAENKEKHMKKLITTLGLIALVAFGSVCAYAQTTTNTNTPVAVLTTNDVPTINGGLLEIWNALETSGLATATNYAVEPYLTYAPNAPSANRVGGGVFLCYNVSKYIGTGLGVDYLGQFSLVSADVQLKVPTQPFKSTGISWLTNIVVCPFALAGVGKSLSGTGGSAGGDGAIAVTDAGAYVQFGHLWGGRFNTGAAYGRWDNAGIYSGPRYHLFVGWSKGF
jgi:hypothetical protein